MATLGVTTARGKTLHVDETITPQTLIALADAPACPPTSQSPATPTTEPLRSSTKDATEVAISSRPLPRIDIARAGADRASDVDDPSSEEEVDFVIKGVLGEGGMGRVLVAHQRSLGRDVAIKMLHETSDLQRGTESLLGEAKITGSLEHPSIAPIHALGTGADGRPVLVMKKIDGVSWGELLAKPRHEAWAGIEPKPTERLAANVDILMKVCDGIHYAHSRGVIHRDIKPSNVMVGAYGEVYIVDWGVAMRTRRPRERAASDSAVSAGASEPMNRPAPPLGVELAGTPSYMAPEMALGAIGSIDERTDVYLIGATLHVILTGRTRHSGVILTRVLAQAVASPPYHYSPSVPAELAAICNRACAADPAERFESVLALRRALADFLRHRSSIAMCRQLATRAEELARLVAESERDHDDVHHAEIEPRVLALLSECRFGYEQVLREWPSNPVAEAGLGRVLHIAVRFELAHGNAVGARAALAQLRELSGTVSSEAAADRASDDLVDLERRIARTESEARERELKLEQLQRDTDLRVGARQRAFLIAALMPFVVGMVLYVAWSGTDAITHLNMVVVISLMNVALWIAAGVGRAKLLETAVNRRLLAGAAVLLLIWLANRVVGWLIDTPLHIIGATDLFVLAGISGTAWSTQLRRFAVPSAVALIAAVGAVHFGTYWAPLFAITAVVVLFTFASLFIARRHGRVVELTPMEDEAVRRRAERIRALELAVAAELRSTRRRPLVPRRAVRGDPAARPSVAERARRRTSIGILPTRRAT